MKPTYDQLEGFIRDVLSSIRDLDFGSYSVKMTTDVLLNRYKILDYFGSVRKK